MFGINLHFYVSPHFLVRQCCRLILRYVIRHEGVSENASDCSQPSAICRNSAEEGEEGVEQQWIRSIKSFRNVCVRGVKGRKLARKKVRLKGNTEDWLAP